MVFCFSFIIFAKTIRGNNRRDEGDYARLINLTNLIPSLLNNLREGFFLMQNSRCKIQLIGDFFEIDTHAGSPFGRPPQPASVRPPTEGWVLLIVVLQIIYSLRGWSTRPPAHLRSRSPYPFWIFLPLISETNICFCFGRVGGCDFW